MNRNDLPLKEKLAALIEAGRACNPSINHVAGRWGDGAHNGCAMTFAFKAAGVPLADETANINWDGLAAHLGVTRDDVVALGRQIIGMNDNQRAPLSEIVSAIREDRLPTVRPQPTFGGFIWIGLDEAASLFSEKTIAVKSFGDYESAWQKTIVAPMKAKPQPAKKVRVSAKSGTTWPVAKGCYA